MSVVRFAVVALVLTASVVAQSPIRMAPVTTDVLVVGSDGEPIIDLSRAEFEVLVDGAPVAPSAVGSAPSELAVVLMLDVSTSQALKRHEVHTAVAENWLPSLRAGDRARIGVIGEPATFGGWLPFDRTASAASARAIIDRAPNGPSPIWDTTVAALQLLVDAPGAKAVVLVTDGRAAANVLSLDDVIAGANAGDVSISSVSEGGEQYLPQAGGPAERVRSDDSLRRLADTTGGLFVEDGSARRTTSARIDPFRYVRELIETPSRPGPLLTRIMSLMRQRYRVTFAAPADGRPHTLEIRVRRENATVHARRSFVSPK
jgi:hypothetical protein